MWQSGEIYTLKQFEAKERVFVGPDLAQPIDIMFWKEASYRPISVEYSNDIPGTTFGEPNKKITCPFPTHGRKGKMER